MSKKQTKILKHLSKQIKEKEEEINEILTYTMDEEPRYLLVTSLTEEIESIQKHLSELESKGVK